MTSRSARRLTTVCVLVVAAIAALTAAGTASAATLGAQCEGASPIKGRGSTLQALAQLNVWNIDFNTSKAKTACNKALFGHKEVKVKYEQGGANNGSGACLKAFGAGTTEEAKYAEFPFCGTDEAPNSNQRKEIEKHKVSAENESVLSIPVLQGAVALLVNLPETCTAESTTEGAEKRLALSTQVVNKLFEGTIATWEELNSQTNDGGSVISCTNPAELKTAVTRVVRLDKSGTTHIFKEYLAQASENTKGEEVEFEAEDFDKVNGEEPCGKDEKPAKVKWQSIAEGCQNARWPEGTTPVLRPAATGGPAVASTVAATPGSIGYVNLADGRNNGEFTKPTGGEGKKRFWAVVQNNFEPKKPTTKAKFADPATNKDAEKAAQSNCKATVYVNGKGEKFPPASTRKLWLAVRATVKEAKYAICGITYDLALLDGSEYSKEARGGAPTNAQMTSVENYLKWVVGTGTGEGGKEIAKEQDYEELPAKLSKLSKEGLEELHNNY